MDQQLNENSSIIPLNKILLTKIRLYTKYIIKVCVNMFSTKGKTNMSVVCPKCGSKFDYQAQFCDKCGTNIAKMSAIKEQSNSSFAKAPFNSKLAGQIQIISVIEITAGIVGLFVGIILGISAPFISDIIKSRSTDGITYTTNMLNFFMIIGLVLAVLIAVISVLTIFAGLKLYRLENIGRFSSMIIASFTLLMVPFGTVFGIISLYVLTKPETIELMSVDRPRQ